MTKRVLIGLLVMVSMLVMRTTDADATNKILGITIKHGSLDIDVFISGGGGDKLATVAVDLTIGYSCKNPQDRSTNPGEPEQQDFTVTQSQEVDSSDFDGNGQAVVHFSFDLTAVQCHQNNFITVPDSEMAVAVVATTAYKQCNGKEPGPDGINDDSQCFEFVGTVETTKVLEVWQTTCTDTYEFPVPEDEELENCESIVIQHQGGKP